MRLLSHYPYYTQLFRTLAVRAYKLAARRRCAGYEKMEPFIRDKSGLEIGGPSSVFRGNHIIPVYDRCRQIDSANFSERTVWTKEREREMFGPALRNTFVADATDMNVVPDEKYEFVLACHVMEHIANPLKAMAEWKRITAPGGAVLIVLPYRERMFDRRRPFTQIEHLIDDFERGTPESDMTHLDEVLALHDWRADPGGGTAEEFRARCMNNPDNRAMHQHVYNPQLLRQCFEFTGLDVVNLVIEYPYHLIGMASRPR